MYKFGSSPVLAEVKEQPEIVYQTICPWRDRFIYLPDLLNQSAVVTTREVTAGCTEGQPGHSRKRIYR
jgi:hypothetical protein